MFKKRLTEEILDGGRVRFLRLGKEGYWEKIPLSEVYGKVAHALRDGLSKSTFTLNDQIQAEDSDSLRPLVAARATIANNTSHEKEKSKTEQQETNVQSVSNNSISKSLLDLVRLKVAEEIRAEEAVSAYMKQQKIVNQIQRREDALLFKLGYEDVMHEMALK